MTHQIVFYRAPNGDQRAAAPFPCDTFCAPQKAIISPAVAVVSILETTATSKPIKPQQRRHRIPIFTPCDFNRTATLSNLEAVRQAGSRYARQNLIIFNCNMIQNPENERNYMYQQPLAYLMAI